MKLILKSKLKRMVFTNLETDKLYHGIGYDCEINLTLHRDTKINNLRYFI